MRTHHNNGSTDRHRLFRLIVSGQISLVSLVEVLAIAEHRSFRQVGKILHVSQSNISTRVAALEEIIGFQLFDRHDGVSVTYEGQRFLSIINEAISLIDHAFRLTHLFQNPADHHLVIGIQSSSTSGFLHDILDRFVKKSPRTRLMSGEFRSDLLISGLRRREIDIAFTPDIPSSRSLAHDILHVMPLWTETMMAALSEHDPLALQDAVTWNDLADHTFLVRREGIGSWLMAQALPHLEQYGAPPRIEHIMVGRDTLLADVVRRRAVALTSAATTGLSVPGIRLLPLVGNPILLTFHALWSRQNHNPALQMFLKLVKTMTHQNPSDAT
ncbi:LysR family transcriptional regulator [Acetobacter senegalensis]|uniref:LysR family transcriptional regulator n=1 Tax=Acetobacter senegalensis TaxID=446692 RepID=UPI00209E6DAD|nr:LysR family transcriptional regulator [Acetobacter senegalensis]